MVVYMLMVMLIMAVELFVDVIIRLMRDLELTRSITVYEIKSQMPTNEKKTHLLDQ